MREYLLIVRCEHRGCTAEKRFTEAELLYDEPVDHLNKAGWTSDHGTDDRCPLHS